MTDNFKKIEKDFVLSSSAINVYGFRLLTAGYQMAEYLKSPIGYYMHDRDGGVLVRWEDVRVEGDLLMGKPVINLNHPRGQQTCEEIENGFLNAASVGDIVVLESEDVFDTTLCETVLTVTKWYNKECSIVDQPGNRDAFTTKLYDTTGQEINLADYHKKVKPTTEMKKITLSITPGLIGLLGLADGGANTEEAGILNAIQNLYDTAQRVNGLETAKDNALREKDKAVRDLADYQADSAKKEVRNLLDDAMKAKKLAKGLADNLERDYAGKPDALKQILSGMPVYTSVTENLSDKANGQIKNLMDKSWNDLDRAGELPKLKDLSFDAFKEKYKDQFGKDYAGA